jgi:hypothetical protein
MKVIMDDCRSVKESEVSFNMSSVSPNFGSTDGSNYVYIYGDFPYAATSEYAAQGNLVAHFDGINNQGKGDKQHDYSSNASWKDLKNPTFDLPRGIGAGRWLSNGFQALDNDYSFYSASFPSTFPTGTHERTIEVIFRTPETMFPQEDGRQRIIFFYGGTAQGSQFAVVYRGLQRPDECSSENPWIFYPISGNDNRLTSCLSSTPSLTTANTINTVTSTYHTRMTDERTNSYINNIPATIIEWRGSLNTSQEGTFYIGRDLSHSTFLSVRLYDCVLNETQIAENAALDQIRYLAPPTVTIGEAECEEVVVLSPHFLMCKVPPGNIGATDIKIKVNDKGTEKTINYAGAYEYVNPTGNFYISKISPIASVAEGGGTLTLTGNLLSRINEVKIGNVTCTVTSQTEDTYTCSIPPNPAGETDITITVDTGESTKVYRFAKVFEYLK